MIARRFARPWKRRGSRSGRWWSCPAPRRSRIRSSLRRFEVVDEQLKVKTAKLMSGFTKQTFSMHSRNRVRLADVELIVKDLLRKQELLKADKSLARNEVVGCLRRSRESVVNDASRLMRIIEPRTRGLLEARQHAVSGGGMTHLSARLREEGALGPRAVSRPPRTGVWTTTAPTGRAPDADR